MKVLLTRVLVIDILKAFVWQKPMQIISKQTEKLIVGFQLISGSPPLPPYMNNVFKSSVLFFLSHP